MKTRIMIATTMLALAAVATAVLWTVPGATRDAQAHCQVPCGIYDDAARIARLREDATTIGKAVTNIRQLAGSHDAQGQNQLVRWINTKEDHASHVIAVVSEYFLTQKVKPVAPDADGYGAYLKKLADHHAVMVAAMKCKQNADPKKVHELEHAIDALAKHYVAEKKAAGDAAGKVEMSVPKTGVKVQIPSHNHDH
jgi:nickel superoxide dismutase